MAACQLKMREILDRSQARVNNTVQLIGKSPSQEVYTGLCLCTCPRTKLLWVWTSYWNNQLLLQTNMIFPKLLKHVKSVLVSLSQGQVRFFYTFWQMGNNTINLTPLPFSSSSCGWWSFSGYGGVLGSAQGSHGAGSAAVQGAQQGSGLHHQQHAHHGADHHSTGWRSGQETRR